MHMKALVCLPATHIYVYRHPSGSPTCTTIGPSCLRRDTHSPPPGRLRLPHAGHTFDLGLRLLGCPQFP